MKNLVHLITSLTAAAAIWTGFNYVLFQIVLPRLPGGIKAMGTFPTGFFVIGLSLFSVYFCAKLGKVIRMRLG